MGEVKIFFGQGTAAKTYFRTGWAPAYVEIKGAVEEDDAEWNFMIVPAGSIEVVDSTGIRTLGTTDGLGLCKFSDGLGDVPGAGGTPSDIENGRFWEANGFYIDDGVVAIADGNPYLVRAYQMDGVFVRGVHDGTTSSGTYFEDASIDFRAAGVSGNGKFIIINESNDNYAYVGPITKPAGKANYCRIYTYEDENLVTATAAADFDTNDVCYIIERAYVQHPLSGIGLMT
jgi:hypothetical protein